MKLCKPALKILNAAFCLLVIFSLVACAAPAPKFNYESGPALVLSLKNAAAYPEVNLAVFSDPHVYDTSLGTTGKAFEDYLAKDRKLLRESSQIFDSAIASISNLKAGIVLVPGDLSKDGELASHQLAAKYLGQLKAAGKTIYVVPGNHDINNGWAFRYVGDSVQHVANITPEQFRQIYADYGFNSAIKSDSDSLSYLAEPVPGLWLLCLDSCEYKDNVPDKEPIVGGKFSHATLQWIESTLAQAARENKAVIVMMHHGTVEHFNGQKKNYGEYIVDDYQAISKMFAEYNVRLVFTGHFHAQDVTEAKWDDGKFLFDVETGSTVTYPCPYRVVNIGADQQAAIRSERVTAIPSHPTDFQEYAKAYLEEGIAGIAVNTLMGYKIGRSEAETLSGDIAKAFEAHYGGDESLPPGQQVIRESGLSPLAWLVIQFRKDLIYGLWKDLPPPDNNVTLNLKDGSWK